MKERNIAIVTTNLYKYSETFIHAALPFTTANIHILYAAQVTCPKLPAFAHTGQFMARASLFQKLGFAKNKMSRLWWRASPPTCYKNRIEAVL